MKFDLESILNPFSNLPLSSGYRGSRYFLFDVVTKGRGGGGNKYEPKDVCVGNWTVGSIYPL